MKTYEFEIEKTFHQGCGDDYTIPVPVKVQVTRMMTEENQLGVVVIIDSPENERIIGCSLLHPDEEDNYFRGVRYALNRMLEEKEIAYQIFLKFCQNWAEENFDIEKFDPDPFATIVEGFKMIGEVLNFRKELEE